MTEPPKPPDDLSEKSDADLDADAKAHQREVWKRWLKKWQPLMGYSDEQVDEMIKRYRDTHGHEGGR